MDYIDLESYQLRGLRYQVLGTSEAVVDNEISSLNIAEPAKSFDDAFVVLRRMGAEPEHPEPEDSIPLRFAISGP